MVLGKLLHRIHYGSKLDLLLVFLQETREHLFLIFGKEGELFGGLAGLQLQDLWLCDLFVSKLLQDRVGLVPHKKVGQSLGVFDEADVLAQRVLLQLVHQLLLFLGVQEGHIADLLLISTDQVYLVYLHLDQLVHEAIFIAELS